MNIENHKINKKINLEELETVLKLIQKISGHLTQEEVIEFSKNPEKFSFKLTPKEMECLKGGIWPIVWGILKGIGIGLAATGARAMAQGYADAQEDKRCNEECGVTVTIK